MRNEKTGKVISDNVYEIRKDMKQDRLKRIFHDFKVLLMVLSIILTIMLGMILIVKFMLWLSTLISYLFAFTLAWMTCIIFTIILSHLERWRGRVEFKRNEDRYWRG